MVPPKFKAGDKVYVADISPYRLVCPNCGPILPRRLFGYTLVLEGNPRMLDDIWAWDLSEPVHIEFEHKTYSTYFKLYAVLESTLRKIGDDLSQGSHKDWAHELIGKLEPIA